MNTAEQLLNILGTRGEVMIFWQGRAVCIDRLFRTGQAMHFSGYDRNGDDVEIVVPQAEIDVPKFMVTSKARVNWPFQ